MAYGKTTLTEVTNQIQQFWSPIFTKELRENLLLGTIVRKDEYEGTIRQKGDRVTVSQVVAPTGENRTVGTDADVFNAEKLTTQKVTIQADKRAVAAFEFEDLVDIQSLIDKENPEVMDALQYAVRKQINDYLYTLVSPSTSAPDHDLSSVADLNNAQMKAIRVLSGEAKWMQNKPWYALCSPAHHADAVADTTMASSNYGATDAPIISGQMVYKRWGYNFLEDNTRSGDYSLFFHPDFMHLCMQTEARIKISDLHGQKKFGYVMSVDIIYGAKLGINGSTLHIRAQ